MTREKKILIFGTVFANLLFIILFFNGTKKIEVWAILLCLVLINSLFYFISQIEKISKKLGFETRLDGDLEIKKPINKFGIVNCPNCNEKTISYFHAKKQPQKCGLCGKSYKAINFKRRNSFVLFTLLIIIILLFFFNLPMTKNIKSWITIVLIFISGYVLSMGGELEEV